jgi:hypothetical protein
VKRYDRAEVLRWHSERKAKPPPAAQPPQKTEGVRRLSRTNGGGR